MACELTPTCSPCLLTSGFVKSCDVKVPGGNNTVIYIVPRCKVVSYEDAEPDGVIDSVTLSALSVFYAVYSDKDSVTTQEDVTLPNGFITQTVVFKISNVGQNADQDIGAQIATDFANDLLSTDGGFVVIVTDRAGIRRIYGKKNGLELSAGSKLSGAALADVSGNTITLSQGEPQYAPVLDSCFVIPV